MGKGSVRRPEDDEAMTRNWPMKPPKRKADPRPTKRVLKSQQAPQEA